MRILYFNYIVGLNSSPVGALAKSTAYIRELKEKGYDIQVNWQSSYVKKNSGPGELFVVRSKFRMFLSRFVHEPKKLLQNIGQIIDQLKKVKLFMPDIIFERLENYYLAAAFVAKLKKIPLVVEADAPVVYEYKKFYGRKNLHLPFLPELIEKYTLKRADAVFCISSEMKKYYVAKGIDPKKITITPNGCDPGIFYPQLRNSDIQTKMRLKNQVVIGWVGSLYGWAGIENLISLVQELAESNPQVSFLFVGGGKNKEIFQDKLLGQSYSDRIHLPGAVSHDEVNDYLSCMDIVLAPYPKLDFWYASSMKVFEYMSAGKAVVTSNIGQLSDIIDHRVDGLLYEPDNFFDLKEKVEELINNRKLREQLGANARQSALDKYTWKVLAGKMAEVFEKVQNRYSNE